MTLIQNNGKPYVNPLEGKIWIPILLCVIVIGIKLLKLYGMNLVVTNKRVVGKVGVFKIHTLDHHIDKVDNVSFKAGLFMILFLSADN